MPNTHTQLWRRLLIAFLLLTVIFGLTFSNRFASWAARFVQNQSQTENKTSLATSVRRGEPKRSAQAAAGASKDEEEDADLPPIARGRIEKEEYLEKRDEYIQMLRGLPYPDGKSNVRVDAIRQMQTQEIGRPAAALNTWVPIGPAPIPNGQTSPILPVSGRVTAIAVHPTNPNIVYVGTAQGGAYRSLNGGATWTSLMDNALTLAVGSIAISPSDPSLVFVGTGEGNFSADCYFGVGVYIIQNADSASPTLIGPLNKDSGGADVMTGRSIGKVLVHPTDPNIIFVATTSGTAGNGGGTTGLTLPARGLYRSVNALSANPTFTKLTVATANGGDRSSPDATFEPGNPNNVLCTVLGFNGTGDGGIYRSTNALDASPTFTRTLTLGSATATVRADLAINKVGSTVTVIAATAESSTGRVRRSTDGGATWSATLGGGSNGFCGGQCVYDNEPGIHPNDANIVLLGGATIFLRSTNAAAATPTFASSGAGLHADHHAIVFAPSDPTIVYEGNDGGIFKSTDTGATWSSINNAGFSATQFQSLAVHPRDRNFSMGGTQDNGTNFYRPDATWIRADFGDGGYALIDQTAYDNTSVTAYHTYFNQVSANPNNVLVGFGRITNIANAQEDGWSFLGFSGGSNNGIGNDTAVLFYAPMTLGPGNPNTLYFGTDRLYRSSNQGDTMTVVSQAPIVTGVPISSIAISPQDDNVRVVGLSNGRVYATATGATTLTNITSGSFPARAVGRVAVDPSNKNTAYVTFLGFGVAAGQHIWKTTDLNSATPTWVAAGNGLPDVPTNAFVIDPQHPTNLYAGTDIGVYQSTDGGANWIPFGMGMPRVAVFDLAIQSPNRILRAATHGRGIFEISLPGATTPLATLTQGNAVTTPLIDNGNGVLDPGEDGTMIVPLSNIGNTTATGITATLTTTTPGVTILNGTSAYANIATGGSQNNITPFAFRVSKTAFCGLTINFTLTVAYNDPASPRTFTIVVPTLPNGSTTSAPSTFTYAGAPAAIPDNSTTGVFVPLNVSGLTNAVASVKFTIGGTACNTTPGSTTVGLDHTYVGDLAIFLISPTGTAVELTQVDGNNNGVNMCQTVFDDAAAADFGSGTAPFTGSFRPLEPLSNFIGEDGNGDWTVAIFDLGPADTGTLRAFSLEIKTATCTKANTQTTIASSANPSIVGQPVTLTATVAPAGVATGTVQFKDNGVNLGAPIALAANGTASITTSALALGIHPITAVYSGDSSFNSSTGSLSQVVSRLTVGLTDPLVCTGPGNTLRVTAAVTNSANVSQNITFTANPQPGLVAVPGTCTSDVPAVVCTVVNGSTVSATGALPAGVTVTFNYLVQVANNVQPSTQLCVNSSVTFPGGVPATVQACGTANCPAVGPGAPLSATAPVNDQRAGSVLIYNVYTSATDPTKQNSRLSITNTHLTQSANVHLFFVDGTSCSVSDSFICLTANQTATFLASDLDPGVTGYLVAVAVDNAGCPVNFNYLIGDEFIKFASGHAANLGAEAITAIAGGLPACTLNSSTAQLNFDGLSYSALPRTLAIDSIPSRADGNDTLLILNRIGGNLGTGAATLISLFGILYDDSEISASFGFGGSSSSPGTCQFRSSLSNNFPRLTPRFELFIPAGRTGWAKIFSQADIALLGAVLNSNSNATTTSGAFNQGHNLHKLTLTTAANYVIPVFPPGC